MRCFEATVVTTGGYAAVFDPRQEYAAAIAGADRFNSIIEPPLELKAVITPMAQFSATVEDCNGV